MSAAESEPPPVADLATARANAERARLYADVLDRLALSDRKVPLATLSNAIEVLRGDPATAGLLAYDEFGTREVLLGKPPAAVEGAPAARGPYPRAITAADVLALQSYVQATWIRSIGREPVEGAVAAVAAMHRVHPVRDWLDGLRWDGKPRLDSWLPAAFGAVESDYTAAVGAKLLIAAVRRIRRPGCQFDHVPVFEGPQGVGKSSVFRSLFSDAWFSDSLPADVRSKDAALGLQGVWCVELAEIEQLIRSDVETIKAFVTRRVDRLRPPYGRTFQDYPRQSIMVATTNETDYLRDASGNRRFWPVRCRHADVEWVSENREQLWAEAAAREAAGEAHYLTEAPVVAVAEQAQRARLQDDVWEDRVLAWVSRLSLDEVSSADALAEIGVPPERQNRAAQLRIAAILRGAGWESRVVKVAGRPFKRWLSPSHRLRTP